MELEEIKKDCKIVTNEEHQGEELYFDEKPTNEIIETLKENGYRWHRVKHCWYRKLNYTGTTKGKQKNYLGVKLEDLKMIKNKNQLKIRLKENKESLIFETIMNKHKPELVGTKRKANIVQTNAFTLLTTKNDGEVVDSWIYYSDTVQVKDNIMSYLDIQGNPFIQIRILEVA